METPIDQFRTAITNDDTAAARAALQHAEVAAEIDGGLFADGRPPLLEARGAEMVDLLLQAGADIGKVNEFWSSGFWLEQVSPEVSARLLEVGALPTIHTAAALGLATQVGELLDGDPTLLEAPGGDGATPLHFVRTVEVAEVLINRGADLNARDRDHRSTPAPPWRRT